MNVYKTHGTCSRAIEFEVEDGILTHCHFVAGCPGNTQGVAALATGMPIDKVIQTLKNIPCRGNTSCPDQLARALEEYKKNNA